MSFSDDEYAICQAKTTYREAMNNGNVELLLSVFANKFTNMSEGQPSWFGGEAPQALRITASKLFSEYNIRLGVIMARVVIDGDSAFDYGWHQFELTPRQDGLARNLRYRYFERWARQPDGAWKITFLMTNHDPPPQLLEDRKVRGAPC